MSVMTLTMDGREYAVIPMEKYRQAFDEHGVRALHEDEMTEQDRGDVAESQRRAEKEESVPYEEARKLMGLELNTPCGFCRASQRRCGECPRKSARASTGECSHWPTTPARTIASSWQATPLPTGSESDKSIASSMSLMMTGMK
jgi:hypothetical protein